MGRAPASDAATLHFKTRDGAAPIDALNAAQRQRAADRTMPLRAWRGFTRYAA